MEPSSRPLTLLRTAAGSPPSVSQYRAFQALGCRVVAVDCDPAAVGFHFADAAHRVPRADDPDYLARMLEVCREEAVDLLLPALDEELVLCARNRARFEAAGTRLLVSPPEALQVCTDKLKTYQLFRDLGVPTPATLAAADYREGALAGFPLVIKPRSGRGGTGVHRVQDHREAAFFASYVADAVVQAFCPGDEYTIDVLADPAGEVRICSPRRRLAVDSGISSRGVTEWRAELLAPVRRVTRALGLVGPINIQCFIADTPQFTEINARLAGTAILSQAAGVPYFQGILGMARGRPAEPWLKPAEPVVMYRYWAELFRPPEARP